MGVFARNKQTKYFLFYPFSYGRKHDKESPFHVWSSSLVAFQRLHVDLPREICRRDRLTDRGSGSSDEDQQEVSRAQISGKLDGNPSSHLQSFRHFLSLMLGIVFWQPSACRSLFLDDNFSFSYCYPVSVLVQLSNSTQKFFCCAILTPNLGL